MILRLCSDRIAASVSGQFAKSGIWEEAWRVDPKCTVEASKLSDYVGNSTEIAFESFFDDVFIGVRCRGTRRTLVQFASDCVNALSQSSPKDFALALDRYIGIQSHQPAQFAEIGCVNAWKCVGPLRLSRTSNGFPAFDDVWPLVQRSSCGLDKRYAKAIEFGFSGPCEHWLGLPISCAEGSRAVDGHMLQEALMRYAAADNLTVP